MRSKNVKPQIACVVVMVGTALAGAFAQESSIKLPLDNAMSQLKPGAGVDTVRRDCGICHSTDYIVLQRADAQQWDAEVKKMIAVFGAPIGASDAKTISDYLAANYVTHEPAREQKTPRTQP